MNAQPKRLLVSASLILFGIGVASLAAEAIVQIFFDEPGEYNVAISTNGAGMRGQREYPVQKPPGARNRATRRFLCFWVWCQ